MPCFIVNIQKKSMKFMHKTIAQSNNYILRKNFCTILNC